MRRILRTHIEELVPEAKIDAQIGKHAPSKDGCRGKDGLVVGGKNHRQEDGKQPGDAEQDAVEELAVAGALLVLDGLPEVEAGEPVGEELGDEGDGLAGLQG